MDVTAKTIVITGGGSGIGFEMAKSFALDGATVIITGRQMSKLEEAAKENANITPYECDVSKDEDMIKFRDYMEAKGGVDFFINNAGVIHMFDIKDSSYDINKEFQEINIDIMGVIRGVHYFLPMLMKKEKAYIMNVSSALAYVPWAAAPIYCATKAFVHSYTQSLRKQLADTNITVFECLPPMVETPMTSDLDAEGSGFSKMPSDKFVTDVRKALDRNQLEITPGQSSQLAFMARLAPGFIFGQVNNGYENFIPSKNKKEAEEKDSEEKKESEEDITTEESATAAAAAVAAAAGSSSEA